MSSGEDFSDVATEFRGIRAPGEELVRAVERGRRRLVRGMIVGVILSVLLCASAIFVLWRDHDVAAVVFAAMLLGTVVSVRTFTAYSQRQTWEPRSATTRGFLELETERRRDWIRRMRFLQWLTPVLAAAILVHQVLLLPKHPHALSVLPYAICAWLAWHASRRKAQLQREEADLVGKLAALDDTSFEI